MVLGPPDRPPNGELIKQIMDQVKLNLLWSLPMFVKQVAKILGGMQKMQSLDHLCYTGGPLPLTGVGDGAPRSREAEGEGYEDFCIPRSGSKSDLPRITRGGGPEVMQYPIDRERLTFNWR